MIIEAFVTADIVSFLKLAAQESWVAEPWEFDFLLAEFPQGCFVARESGGQTAGFVTALRHGNSGWIGNLIVAQQFRGRGIGEALFKCALESLQQSAVESIWLTASSAGSPLYEKHGFSGVDTIIRWVGTGRGRRVAHLPSGHQDLLAASSNALDVQTWGDQRSTLLETTARRGRLLQNESGFMVLQPCGDALQIGPFSARSDAAAELLLSAAARTVALGTKILVDAPASNRSALRLYNRRKMRISGTNLLMYAGTKPAYRPELLYGLASMGSCG